MLSCLCDGDASALYESGAEGEIAIAEVFDDLFVELKVDLEFEKLASLYIGVGAAVTTAAGLGVVVVVTGVSVPCC